MKILKTIKIPWSNNQLGHYFRGNLDTTRGHQQAASCQCPIQSQLDSELNFQKERKGAEREDASILNLGSPLPNAYVVGTWMDGKSSGVPIICAHTTHITSVADNTLLGVLDQYEPCLRFFILTNSLMQCVRLF